MFATTLYPLFNTDHESHELIFYWIGGIREASLKKTNTSNRDVLRVSPDSDTMSLRNFGGIGSIRLESRKNSLKFSKITYEHAARKVRNQLRIS